MPSTHSHLKKCLKCSTLVPVDPELLPSSEDMRMTGMCFRTGDDLICASVSKPFMTGMLRSISTCSADAQSYTRTQHHYVKREPAGGRPTACARRAEGGWRGGKIQRKGGAPENSPHQIDGL